MAKVPDFRSSVRRELALPKRGDRRSRPRFGLLAAAFLGCGLATGPAAAQAPFRQELLRGFSSLEVERQASPELADVDADGDLDAVVGDFEGTIRLFANQRTPSSPLFSERIGAANPFGTIVTAGSAAPELVDLDADGDLDVVVGEVGGGLRYFENTRVPVSPGFVERTGSANPFAGFDVGDYSTPTLADLDGDGDRDAVVGEKVGVFYYFRNTGSSNSPAFLAISGSANPFAGIDLDGWSTPALTDIDGDGDLDAVFGELGGHVHYFANTGTTSAPAFVAITGSASPFFPVDAGYSRGQSSPELADFDGDGDIDVLLGESGGSLPYFANQGSSSAPAFVAATGSSSPFDGIDLGFIFSRPELVDLDADGDLDALTGDYYGKLRYFANTGASSRPAYLELTGSLNPFDAFGPGLGIYVSPDLADLDGDGDFDLIFGELSGNLNFIENTGSAAAPSFVEVTGTGNPFASFSFDTLVSPELVDLDGDGDLDGVVGTNNSERLIYLANTGSAAAPAYLQLTGSANPFAGLTPAGAVIPQLIDLDRDGDLDLVTGDYFGKLRYFPNTGTAMLPAFVELTGSGHPFAGIDVGFNSSPKVADLDQDGDFDVLVGENEGRLIFYSSTVANLFADGFESGNLLAWSPPIDL